MKLSMKSRYGLRALIDLTINSKTEQVALNSIAERNKISPQYLEQVFASLRKAGIVKSIKGSQGGYFLSRPPQEITVSCIIEALEGDYRIEDEELFLECIVGTDDAFPIAVEGIPPLVQDLRHLRCILAICADIDQHLILLLMIEEIVIQKR